MTTAQWEEVEVPRGAFLSWGEAVGQAVTGKVLAYDENGGTDFGGNTCPQLQVELVEPAFSVNKAGQRSDFPVGELVVLNCGLVSLKRAVRSAALNPGDLVKIELANLVPTSNGTVKEMSIKVARGAGNTTPPAPAPAPAQPVAAAPAPAQPVAPAAPPTAQQFVNAQGVPATAEAVAALRAAGVDPAAVYPGYDGSLG